MAQPGASYICRAATSRICATGRNTRIRPCDGDNGRLGCRNAPAGLAGDDRPTLWWRRGGRGIEEDVRDGAVWRFPDTSAEVTSFTGSFQKVLSPRDLLGCL